MRRLIAVLAVVGIPVAAVVGLYTYSAHNPILPGLRGCAYVRVTHAQGRCYERQVARMVEADGLASALDEIDSRARHDHGLKARCHMALHAVGEKHGRAAAREGRVVANLDTSTNCREGYAHGVLVAQLEHRAADRSGRDGLAAIPRAACSTQPPDPAYTDNCMHALGHAYRRVDDASLADVVAACRSNETCMWGAFMEDAFVAARQQREESRRESPGDAVGRCARLDGTALVRGRTLCAAFLPVRAGVLGGEEATAVRYCNAIEPADTAMLTACATSVGAHATSSHACSALDARSARASCRHAFRERDAGRPRDDVPQGV